MEEWRPIVGYEGYYEISNQGNVKSLTRIIPGKHGSQTVAGKPKRIFKLKTGYWIVNLSKDGTNKTHLIHRLVGQAFVENPYEYDEIDHIDRDSDNNTSSNLRWATRSMNIQNRNPIMTELGKSEQRYIIITKENRFQVRIPRKKCVGTFGTLAEAVLARDTYLEAELGT